MYLSELSSYLNDKNGILFNSNTMEFYQLEDNLTDILFKFNANVSLSPEELNQIREIEESLKLINNCKEYTSDNITTIKIHISNDCNLRCSYCYASHGNYGGEKAIMTKEVASKLIKNLEEKFPNIDAICFFGGEPLMAVDAIQTICEFYNDKDVAFLMQTNGTIYNKRIHDLIKKYDINVTVSIDGPKEIHDIHRIYPNGKGSYENILNNVRKLNDDSESVSYVQGTYTSQAAKILTKSKLAKKIQEDFGITRISVYDVVTDDSEMKIKDGTIQKLEVDGMVKLFVNDVFDESFNNNETLKLIFSNILSQKRNDRFCNAGSTQLSVDINGYLWPCQLFTNHEKYRIGNVYDELENVESGLKNSLNKLQVLDIDSHEDCTQCISKFWCRRCVLRSLNENTDEITISKNHCKIYSKLTEDVLNEISKLIVSDEYDDFVSKFDKLYSMELV